MAITKIQSESLNLADDYTFTGDIVGAGGANTPAFAAKHFEAQGTAAATITKMLLQTEVFDTDSCYDAPNSKFIPNVAGKYYLYFKFGYESDYDHRSVRAMIYKNGSNISEKRFALSADYMDNFSSILSFDTSAVVEANGTTDYFEAYFYTDQTGALKGANTNWTQFTGYKIIE
tara:strand:- start:33 stop:554 length:522 start_codon:yes stop_codon:yes gene_type:complete